LTATASGLKSEPMVYAYFGSKDGLYLAYVERAGEELLDRLRAAGDQSGEADARLRAGVVEFLRFVAERREGWAVLYAEAAAQGGPLAGRIAKLRGRIIRIVERLLSATVASGHSGSEERKRVEGTAHALVGAGESLANWWLSHPEIDAEEVAGWLLVSGGLPGPPGTGRDPD
jgi:AcrR family transcriptional regulator